MRNYSYLLFLSSVLAADNNTLAHMVQEQPHIQVGIIFPFFITCRGGACPALLHPGLPPPLNIQVRTIDLSLSLLNAILTN